MVNLCVGYGRPGKQSYWIQFPDRYQRAGGFPLGACGKVTRRAPKVRQSVWCQLGGHRCNPAREPGRLVLANGNIFESNIRRIVFTFSLIFLVKNVRMYRHT